MSENVGKKYELTNKCKLVYTPSPSVHGERIVMDRRTYQIKALRDFGDVKAGDVGGYIESEDNLSHEGDCWIYDDSMVCSRAVVEGSTKVCDESLIGGDTYFCICEGTLSGVSMYVQYD